ncbi:hypothetical protein TVAG_413260 [Trichomonas vaginalis G3]|uniref:Uncharacterized protein n=1 Tax=Trichomonas vaginalis (strain ATCC PRA-98 / G3) TaxID=412133 RepID=A2G3X2_TRIV3|nr:hypothetical protein TVAGG3_0113630 [Trichomonas vaginalis G3]EAX88146.1 hypothetical protein TVAG_413260 [Trichomonas vaginalis G3]KAI5545073.1 hypothetical protein TVAGG3_0113630 [Trichomonas vaginalis G3]|eukprot:XP_001301076.1 hypothetical protein [Trichomonas vaginalis G3]
MILLFEDAKTPLSRFYPVIHNAEMAFEELRQKGNRFASIFYQWLLAKTINSEYGVIWAFAYLTTPKGLIYAREAIHNREFPPPANGYTSLFYYIEKPKDPIDDVTEILIEERVNVAVEEILTEAPEARWPEKDLEPPNNKFTEAEVVQDSHDETVNEAVEDLDVCLRAIKFMKFELKNRCHTESQQQSSL